MIIKYSIEDVGGKGKGIIAQEEITKGTKVWSIHAANYLEFKTKEELSAYLEKLPLEEQKLVLMHAYGNEDKVHFCRDDSKYMNHSFEPNNGLVPELVDWDSLYALRDIKKGEELLEDYGTYTVVPWFEEIAKEKGVMSCIDLINHLKAQE